MAAGYLLRRIGILNGGFVETLDKFNFRVTLPILLITDLGRADFYQVWDTRFVLYCFFVTLASIAAAALLSLPALKNRSERGEFIQASFRGSAAVLGIAFIQNIYGNAGMAPLMMLGAVPLYNVMTVVILSFTAPGSGGSGRQSIKKSMTKIVTNPLIIGIAAGLLLSLLRIELPLVVDKTLDQFAVTATPLALVSLGAGFEAKKAAARLKPALFSSFIKLMLQPGRFSSSGRLSGLSGCKDGSDSHHAGFAHHGQRLYYGERSGTRGDADFRRYCYHHAVQLRQHYFLAVRAPDNGADLEIFFLLTVFLSPDFRTEAGRRTGAR